jgi:hypothetical protein
MCICRALAEIQPLHKNREVSGISHVTAVSDVANKSGQRSFVLCLFTQDKSFKFVIIDIAHN